jgi:ribosomal protein S27E
MPDVEYTEMPNACPFCGINRDSGWTEYLEDLPCPECGNMMVKPIVPKEYQFMLPKYSTGWLERMAAVSGFVQCMKCNAIFDRTRKRLVVNIDYEWPEPGFNWCRRCKRKYPATQRCKVIIVRHFDGKCPGCGAETIIHQFSHKRSNAYCPKCESFHIIFKPDKPHPICDGRALYARRELSSWSAYRGRFQQSWHGKINWSSASELPERQALSKLMPTTRVTKTLYAQKDAIIPLDNLPTDRDRDEQRRRREEVSGVKITTPTTREVRTVFRHWNKIDRWSTSYSKHERKQREFERFIERDIDTALDTLDLVSIIRERAKNLCLKLYYANRRGRPWSYCLTAVVFHTAQESKQLLRPEEVWSRIEFKRRFNMESFKKILGWTLEILDVTQYTLENWDGSQDKSPKALMRRYMVILDEK